MSWIPVIEEYNFISRSIRWDIILFIFTVYITPTVGIVLINSSLLGALLDFNFTTFTYILKCQLMKPSQGVPIYGGGP